MANLVYKRVSTDQQSTARQNLVLNEAGIEDPVVFEADPCTSSRLHPLQRPKFGELLAYARPGDTVHISEMFRLVRGTGHILDVLDVLHRDRLALRIHDGAFSAMDLTTRHPRTGKLLSTVKFMVQPLAAAGELQRDLQRELTYDGLRAAEAKGSKGGHRRTVAATKTDDVRTAYVEGRSIAALARVARRAPGRTPWARPSAWRKSGGPARRRRLVGIIWTYPRPSPAPSEPSVPLSGGRTGRPSGCRRAAPAAVGGLQCCDQPVQGGQGLVQCRAVGVGQILDHPDECGGAGAVVALQQLQGLLGSGQYNGSLVVLGPDPFHQTRGGHRPDEVAHRGWCHSQAGGRGARAEPSG
ncbi:recombinase family protein [Streptomyces sp. NPDC046939]|uniref:recombinase family protein n=1 Tax=Streptomyces sp. NPDC046939 TaxID=3155376 RepID=UPI0033D07B7F